jgi:hypothetical protein
VAPSLNWLKKRAGTPERRLPMLKTAILEFIAEMYSTTVKEIRKDIQSLEGAEDALHQFCEAMEEAGY